MAGLATTFGSGAMTNPIDDVKKARCILAIGTNTTEAHPVIGMLVKQAAHRLGTKLIVVNPHWIELCLYATLWIRPKPGTDLALIAGMMKVISDEGLADEDFVAQRCEDFDAFKESLKAFDLDTVNQLTGVPQDTVVEAARIYAQNSPASILYAMGITQHAHGTDNVMALADLAMLTGNIGKPGAGVNPLRGHNNVQGACDMGCLPDVLSGYQRVTDTQAREKFEDAWRCDLDIKPGLTVTEIFDAAHEGKIKAMYIVGENPVLSDPDITHVRAAIEKLDFLVVQDIFLSETAQMADVVLPASSFVERDGTFTNTERRVQLVRKAIEPVGDTRPDWWITSQVAQRMGAQGFDYTQASQIMAEVARLTPSYGGITYERIENGGLQWPCPTPDHPGTPTLHVQQFSRGKGRFMPLEYKPPVEQPDIEYPLVLTTGRSRFQFHTGTLTRKARGLNQLLGEEWVDINPEDAMALGIAEGDVVRVQSRRGRVTAKARVTDNVPKGVIFMTFHFAETPTNVLTHRTLDPIAKIPELKVSVVRVERVAAGT